MIDKDVKIMDAFIETAHGTKLKLSSLPMRNKVKPFEFFTVSTHFHGRIVCVVKEIIGNRVEAIQVPVTFK